MKTVCSPSQTQAANGPAMACCITSHGYLLPSCLQRTTNHRGGGEADVLRETPNPQRSEHRTEASGC
eukprot:186332-Amphidinium_carterae.1